MSGNNVSHAKNRTRRRFIPNLQNVKLRSEILGRYIQLSVCTSMLRTIEKNDGLDGWLLKQPKRKLAGKALKLKKMIETAKAA